MLSNCDTTPERWNSGARGYRYFRRRLDNNMSAATDTQKKKNGSDVLYAVRAEAIHMARLVAVMS